MSERPHQAVSPSPYDAQRLREQRERMQRENDEVLQHCNTVKVAAAAERKRKVEFRHEIILREEDHESWRAQVYAINKLMAMREAKSFAKYGRDREQAASSAVAEAVEMPDSLTPVAERGSQPSVGCGGRASPRPQSLPLRAATPRSCLQNGGCISYSSDNFIVGNFGAAFSRVWGLATSSTGSSSSGRDGVMTATDASGLTTDVSGKSSSGSAMAGAASTSTTGLDEHEAPISAVLTRAREAPSLLDMAEELKKLGSTGGSYRQQLLREVQARATRLGAVHAAPAAKEEERQIARAQIYAINRLLRTREEAACATNQAARREP